MTPNSGSNHVAKIRKKYFRQPFSPLFFTSIIKFQMTLCFIIFFLNKSFCVNLRFFVFREIMCIFAMLVGQSGGHSGHGCLSTLGKCHRLLNKYKQSTLKFGVCFKCFYSTLLSSSRSSPFERKGCMLNIRSTFKPDCPFF